MSTSSKGIWVLAEHTQGKIANISLQLVSGACQLASGLGQDVCVVITGDKNVDMVNKLASCGADRIIFLESPLLLNYSAELYVEALANMFQSENPEIVLCGATLIGKDLAPRLAARLKTGLVSDCVSLETNPDGSLLLTKPTHGGKVYSRLVIPSAKPQMVTIRPDVMETKTSGKGKSPTVVSITPQFDEHKPGIKTIKFTKGDPKTIGIEEAEIIVSGGRGMGAGSNFRILEELAEVMGASVAGSLAVVDAGWISSERQVGQTGKTVAPRLYIACGISGASYHTLGMKDSDTVIAINTDRHAPIFKLADVGIVGDVLEVVPAITWKLREIVKSNINIKSDEIVITPTIIQIVKDAYRQEPDQSLCNQLNLS